VQNLEPVWQDSSQEAPLEEPAKLLWRSHNLWLRQNDSNFSDFLLKNGFSRKTFGRTPPEKPKPERSPAKQALNLPYRMGRAGPGQADHRQLHCF